MTCFCRDSDGGGGGGSIEFYETKHLFVWSNYFFSLFCVLYSLNFIEDKKWSTLKIPENAPNNNDINFNKRSFDASSRSCKVYNACIFINRSRCDHLLHRGTEVLLAVLFSRISLQARKAANVREHSNRPNENAITRSTWKRHFSRSPTTATKQHEVISCWSRSVYLVWFPHSPQL